MKKEEMIWLLDFLKNYANQNKQFRIKLIEVLQEINKELEKGCVINED